jgi:5-formyltetrahydrofolate cyclo-ligase
MKKAELRKSSLQKMRTLSKQEHDLKSRQIADYFFSTFDVNSFSAIHTFLPIVKNNEVNTQLIIDKAFEINPLLNIIIPRSDFNTLEMTSHIFTKEVKMKLNPTGILEPEEDDLFDENEIDLIILPLLSFDKNGYRVGYGKGFYDRFLSKCREDVVKVGVSLFDAVEQIEDLNAYDIPLDFCITPEKVYRFEK